MQKLKPVRKVSGVHAVVDADGNQLGVVDPSDFLLDDQEMEDLLRRHAERKLANGAVHEFIKRIDARIKKTGAAYHQALSEVARADPELAEEYNASVLGTKPL